MAGEDRDVLLAEAVRVLTRAVREAGDWAEFVSAALAGAAANVGGVETALTGRPGSWEADLVRQLVAGTVGHDGEWLLEHRTDPVVVDVYVEDLMIDNGYWKLYDEAQAELGRRYDAFLQRSLTEDEERRVEALDDLQDRLVEQQEADWQDYGDALARAVLDAVERRGITLQVDVRVDVDTIHGPEDTSDIRRDALADQLLVEAITVTPLPGDGRNPLERLQAGDAGGTPA